MTHRSDTLTFVLVKDIQFIKHLSIVIILQVMFNQFMYNSHYSHGAYVTSTDHLWILLDQLSDLAAFSQLIS